MSDDSAANLGEVSILDGQPRLTACARCGSYEPRGAFGRCLACRRETNNKASRKSRGGLTANGLNKSEAAFARWSRVRAARAATEQ